MRIPEDDIRANANVTKLKFFGKKFRKIALNYANIKFFKIFAFELLILIILNIPLTFGRLIEASGRWAACEFFLRNAPHGTYFRP